MHLAARSRRKPRLERWLSWLEPLSTWVAAVWGCALGLDTTIAAALVFSRTHQVAPAALTGAGVLAASTVALVAAFHFMACGRP